MMPALIVPRQTDGALASRGTRDRGASRRWRDRSLRGRRAPPPCLSVCHKWDKSSLLIAGGGMMQSGTLSFTNRQGSKWHLFLPPMPTVIDRLNVAAAPGHDEDRRQPAVPAAHGVRTGRTIGVDCETCRLFQPVNRTAPADQSSHSCTKATYVERAILGYHRWRVGHEAELGVGGLTLCGEGRVSCCFYCAGEGPLTSGKEQASSPAVELRNVGKPAASARAKPHLIRAVATPRRW